LDFFLINNFKYLSRDLFELDLESELEELEDESDELLLLLSEDESLRFLCFDFLLLLYKISIYLRFRSLESDYDLYLFLLSFNNLGQSFFLLVKSVLPVSKLATEPALIIGLWTFTLFSFTSYFYFQSFTLKLYSLFIFNSFFSIISLFKILTDISY
jgi:hypothetical protein